MHNFRDKLRHSKAPNQVNLVCVIFQTDGNTRTLRHSHLDHPIHRGLRPAVRSFTGKCEGLPLLYSLGDGRLLFEVVEDGLSDEHGVGGCDTVGVLGKAHVLAWSDKE